MLTSQTNVCDTIKHRSPVANGVDVEVEIPRVVVVEVVVDVVIVVVGGSVLSAVGLDSARKAAVKQIVLAAVVS